METSAMITYAFWAAAAAWLTVLAVTALATRPWRPATGPATLALRGEPPAVVSLLAGRLARGGYPATLLDLAARGWMRLGEAEPSRVMCQPSARPLDASLTPPELLPRHPGPHLPDHPAGALGAVPADQADPGRPGGAVGVARLPPGADRQPVRADRGHRAARRRR
jgi:hypothetical protein